MLWGQGMLSKPGVPVPLFFCVLVSCLCGADAEFGAVFVLLQHGT